jgi:hypothetical protein
LKKALVIVCAVAGGARAQPFPVPDGAVTWRAPAECGDGSELRRRIGGYLDHAIGGAPFAFVDVEALDDGTYRADLHIRAGGAVAERTVVGVDCAQVVDAAALVIGMAADQPERAGGAGASDDDGIEARLPPPPVARTLSLRVRGAADLGSIPGGGLGLDAGVALTSGRLAVIASGRWFPRRFAMLEDTPGAGVEVGLRGGAAEACVHVIGGWACLGGEAGAIDGEGVAFQGAQANRSLWTAVTAGLAGDVSLGHGARFVVELGGYFATQRPRYVLDDGTLLYEPSQVGARVYAGLEQTLF